MKKFIEELTEQLTVLKERYAHKKGFVVDSENHVRVERKYGINGTNFAVKGPQILHATIFQIKEDAEKYGMDYYLVDGAGKPIYLRIKKAEVFFAEEIARLQAALEFLNNKL